MNTPLVGGRKGHSAGLLARGRAPPYHLRVFASARNAFVTLVLLTGLVPGCKDKELGEVCESDEECSSELCAYIGPPAADPRRQCTIACPPGCPGGSICIAGLCMLACDPVGEPSECPEGTVCDSSFAACFASCSSDADCGAGFTCSARRLCEG